MKVAIVGGGIVGSAAAAWMLADGVEVTVFERDPEGRPASTGNAGLLNLPEISPLARPGILASVPGWLLDPLGPLTLRARDLPSLTPFLARFAWSARPAQVERATQALAFIMKTALIDHQELARRANLPMYMRRNGAIYLYDTEAAYRSAMGEWKERGRHGAEYEDMSVADAKAMVPALGGGFERVVFTPDQWSVTSPLEVLLGSAMPFAPAASFSPPPSPTSARKATASPSSPRMARPNSTASFSPAASGRGISCARWA